jgi:hypothetical protein
LLLQLLLFGGGPPYRGLCFGVLVWASHPVEAFQLLKRISFVVVFILLLFGVSFVIFVFIFVFALFSDRRLTQIVGL